MGKTDNDLDERFQWREELDPDHIFDEEKAMIKELRGKIPQLEKETDKFVATFLFARRHDVKESASLLTKFYKKKEEYADSLDGHHIPSFKHTKILADNRDLAGLPIIQPRGYRDGMGRMVRIMLVGLDEPGTRDLGFTYTFCIWQIYYTIATEPLNAWRNGTVVLLDLKGAGWRNVDFSSRGRDVAKAMQGVFPTRARAIMLINGGPLLSALLTAAKFVLPRKMMKRVQIVDVTQLKEIVPTEYLVPHFGGASKQFHFPEFFAEIAETEDELFEKGIWKAPDGAAPLRSLSLSFQAGEPTTE